MTADDLSRFIPLSVPEIRGNEWTYVKECLDAGWVSSAGSFVDRFEADFAAYVGTRRAVATSSGTAALHIALLLAGVRPDDEVLVSDLTFIAPANAVRYVGAWPVFIDVEPAYWQMDPERVASFLAQECQYTNGRLCNRQTGRRVAAILPVHVLGHPVDFDAVAEVARRYELPIIEDATESLGARYKDRMVGHLGDVACFSFNGNKIVTTGGGGMIVTDRDDWADRARYLTTQAKDDPIEYIHHEVGFNYRLTNVQAAIGCAQIEQLPAYIEQKRAIAAAYRDALAAAPGVTLMAEASWAYSTFWLNTILIDSARGLDRREMLAFLESQRIQSRPLWQPLHRSRAHQDCQAYGGSVADDLNRDALSLPSSVSLTALDLERVIAAVLQFVAATEVSGV